MSRSITRKPSCLISIHHPGPDGGCLVMLGGLCLSVARSDCTQVSRSNFIKRVCYDLRNNYMLINLNGTCYQYCGIDDATVSSLLMSDSTGRFYNASIKGQFDCRTRPVPDY
jgi:hypothetical protein